jgi:predicted RNase H-like nuclease/NTP pyrophosphatase (non-canonical NTP hydrolase)
MMRPGGTAVDELQRLLLELRRFAKARDWDRYHDPKNLAMAVASEAGELCDVLRWVDNAEADRFAHDPKHQARIAEEAADVALLLLMLCDRAGIDLLQAMRTKLARNREKYPVEKWRGKAWEGQTTTGDAVTTAAAARPGRAATGTGRAAATGEPALAGIDGCPGGWVVARADAGLHGVEFERVERLDELFREAAQGRLTVAIDMPIGLPERDARACDAAARKRLGAPRASSIFAPPCRAALHADGFAAAATANRKACGRGLTRQIFELFSRLRQLDALITPALQLHVREAHPELTFAVLAGGGGLSFPKATAAGRKERLELLRPLLGPLDLLAPRREMGREAVRPDDLLDAAACLVTAHRLRHGRALVLPEGEPERDGRGLRMEIVA